MSHGNQFLEDFAHNKSEPLAGGAPQEAAAGAPADAVTPLSGVRLVGVASTVALGGFLVGFDATVISGAVPFIRGYFNLGGADGGLQLGWAVSSLGWGAMAGNLAAGVLNNRFGRRNVLLLAAALFFASSLAAALSTSFTLFVAARICGGLAVGTALLTAPMYIAEIAPARMRGRLVSLNQLMIVIGISVSFFSNYFLLSLGDESWRWMLGVQVVPATVFFLLLTLVPESPRWLLSKGRELNALQVLTAAQGSEAAQRELASIKASLVEGTRRFDFRDLLTARLRWVMFFGFGIAFFQQATGINAVFYYLPTIFAQAGGGLATAFGQSVFVGLVNVGMTFVAIWLIDRLGRKPLLCIGLTGMTASLLTISWAFHATQAAAGGAAAGSQATLLLIAIAAYVASFAISLGPVMWVMLSEIYPNEQRAAAIAVVGFWNSLVSATITLLFPKELATWGPAGTFLAYGLIAGAGLLFIAIFAPETKGKTLEELAQMLTPAVKRK
ncbi:MAG TPA: sugar porter family MFS transporter [Steroidobacteraceae bacterium]|nr:sugar porter family MFS transporter [Steroidobacteraceae bacterium]